MTEDGARLPPSLQRPLMLASLTSCVVLIEPSPFDVLISVWLLLAALSGGFAYRSRYRVAMLGAAFFLLTTIAGLPFTPVSVFNLRFAAVSVYLVVVWFGLLFMIPRFGDQIGRTILRGWTISAVVTTSITAIIYLFRLPGFDIISRASRLFGLFKDANVFGAAIIPPLIFCISRSVGARGRSKFVWLAGAAVLAAGILLAYSRGAWGSTAISLAAFFGLTVLSRSQRGTSARTVLGFTVAMVVAGVGIAYLVQDSDIGTLVAHRSKLQAYDSERFGTQREAFAAFIENPLGRGPGISEKFFTRATHNLYIRAMVENGAFGFIGLMLLLLSTTLNTTISALRSRFADPEGNTAVVAACLWGVLVESFVIDTLHWRHLWILLALGWWVPSEAQIRRETNAAPPER